jgi:acyl-CoA synthetase (AMP-forming)/AMP-acid ligase II
MLGKLASYKKPTGLVVLDQLPRNTVGKVLKHELRTSYGRDAQNGGSSV